MCSSLICSISDGIVSNQVQTSQKKLQLNIEESHSYALLSENQIPSFILQSFVGLRSLAEGDVAYYGSLADRKGPLMDSVQYVPDDIICYPNMRVEDYLCGIALATSVQQMTDAGELCDLFHINPHEELLELTFEQNRMLGMIQALVRNPKLLLLDHPRDMLSRKVYLLLWRELWERQQKGMTIVVAESSYDNLLVPCDRYIFFRETEKEKEFARGELPVPAKVITLDGADITKWDPMKMEILYKESDRICFLYRETEAQEIAKRICHSGCYDFRVEELSMEEEVFGDYERWMI